MSPFRYPATQIGPDDPPPQEDPTHDVPVYPEQDPPPGNESAIRVSADAERHAPSR
jgi:hypothetical protein